MDSECEGSLVCGQMNCLNETSQYCCAKICSNDSDCLNQECNTDVGQCRLDSYNTDWSKCSQHSPCSAGEGDCDDDSDCEGSYVCGTDNCQNEQTYLDCCQRDIYKGGEIYRYGVAQKAIREKKISWFITMKDHQC